MKTGRSGGAGGVATTPVMLGVTLPAVVVVAVGLTVAPVGGAKECTIKLDSCSLKAFYSVEEKFTRRQ